MFLWWCRIDDLFTVYDLHVHRNSWVECRVVNSVHLDCINDVSSQSGVMVLGCTCIVSCNNTVNGAVCVPSIVLL